MAQETRIAPIELNNDASKIMMDLGDSLAKQNIQREQMAAERAKQMYEMEKDRQSKLFEVQKESSGYISSLKLSPEDYDKAIGLMNTYVKDAIKNKTTDYNSLQSNIQKGLQKINLHGAKLASLDAQVEDFYSRLSNDDKLNFDKKALLQDVKKAALYGEVDGQLIEKSTEEINTDESYVAKIMSGSGAARYWNGAAGFDDLNKLFKDETKIVSESAKIRDQKGLVKTVNDKSVKLNKLFQRQSDDGNVELKVDANGMLEYDTYSQLISNPKINKTFDNMAEQFVKDYNAIKPSQRAAFLKANGLENDDVTKGTMLPARLDPETITDFGNVYETLKRSFATNYIQRNLGNTENTVKGTSIVNKFSSGLQQGTPLPENPDFTAPLDRLRAIVNGDKRFTGEAKESAKKAKVYDITNQFKSLPIFQTVGSKKTYGPSEVTYFPNYEGTGEARIVMRQKEGKPLKVLTIQAFSDLLVPKTDGTGYDPKPKPKPY